jgi:hypothetical protein
MICVINRLLDTGMGKSKNDVQDSDESATYTSSDVLLAMSNAGALILEVMPPARQGEGGAFSREALHAYMVKAFPDSPWLTHRAKKQKKIIGYKAFTKKLSDATKNEISYVEAAALAKPLISFFRHVANANTADKSLFASAERKARIVETSFLKYLSLEVSPRPVSFVPLYSPFLSYVDHPENFSEGDKIISQWSVRCYNSDSSLYRASATLFLLKHLHYLSCKSPIKVLKLANQLARLSITYLDYNFALQVTAKIYQSAPDSVSLDSERLKICLEAKKIFADAWCYLQFTKDQSEIDRAFLGVQTSIIKDTKDRTDLSATDKLSLQVGLLSAWTRSLSRARLFSPFSKLESDIFPPFERNGNLVKALKSGLDKQHDSSPKSKVDPTKFVHWDSYVRGLAMLLPLDEGVELAREEHTRLLKKKNFKQDLLDIELLTEMGQEEYIDTHRNYRTLSTEVFILCQEASAIRLDMLSKEARLTEAMRIIQVLYKLINDVNFFQAKLEVELLEARVLQIASEGQRIRK